MGYFDFYHNELSDQQIDELHGIMATHEAAGMRTYDAALQAVRVRGVAKRSASAMRRLAMWFTVMISPIKRGLGRRAMGNLGATGRGR